MLIPQGNIEQVLVRVVDRQGTSLDAPLAVSSASAGIRVTVDPLFRPVYGPDGNPTVNTQNTEIRFEVEGLALGSNSFTLTSGGVTQDVTVTVVPSDVAATFAPVAPIGGDTTTVTLPAGLRFGRAFVFRSLRGDAPVFVSVAADSLSARVILPPNIAAGDIVIDSVGTTFNPAAGLFGGLALESVPPTATTSIYAASGACPGTAIGAFPKTFWDIAPAGVNFRYYRVTLTGTNLKVRVIAQPSPADAAMSITVYDAACVAPVGGTTTTVTSGQRTVTTTNLVALGTYVVRVGTGTVALPNGSPSPTLGAVRLAFSQLP